MSEWKKLAECYHKRAMRMTELYEEEFKKNYELHCLIDEINKKSEGEKT